MVKKTVLVTGGFGFIGSFLVEALVAQPSTHVHVVDNLSSSPIDVGAFLDLLKHPENLTYDTCSLEQYCSQLGSQTPPFTHIYHLASVVGPVGVLAHAGRITNIIVSDTYRVIDLALRSGAKVVDVSTSEVYGGGRDGYCSEEQPKIIPPQVTVRLEYAVGKLAAEISLVNTTRVTTLDACIVRPFNVAGPRQSGKGGFVLPRFITQALQGEPLTVYNDGLMVRAFTHVCDIVQGLILTMENGMSGEAYNLGNPANKIAIRDLAQRVLERTNSKSQLTFVDPKALFGPLFEEANDKYPNADRAMKELGWSPEYSVDDVIGHTAQYIKGGYRA